MAIIFYYFIRMQLLDGAVKYFTGGNENIYGFIKSFYAPLTEEPAKLLPLLIPSIRKRITRENFVTAALALGLGFGIGEIWLVGGFIAQAPQFADLPWYQFTGFINERFMVCIVHGGMTSFALSRLDKNFLIGLIGSMGLHFAGNFPIYLSKINKPQFGAETWQVILSIWIMLFFAAMVLMLVYFKLGTFEVGKFFYGNSVCPQCGHNYPAPIMAFNSFNKRYERCPACKKWHWVKMWKKE